MRLITAFARLSRFHFLLFALLPYLLGVVVARQELHRLDDRLLWLGMIVQGLVQLSTAYLNDYWDIPTDRLNRRRTLLSGGSGILTTGEIAPRAALIAAGLCQITALILAAAIDIPSAAWLPLIAALGAATLYSMPPFRLVWRGLGELTTGLTAGLLVPMWAYTLQTGQFSGDLLRASLPLTLFVAGMMLSIAAPDIDADRAVGKRTLAVFAGENRVAAVYALLVGAGYLAALLLFRPVALIGAALSLPLAIWAWSGLRVLPDGRWRLLWAIARTMTVPGVIMVSLIASVWAG